MPHSISDEKKKEDLLEKLHRSILSSLKDEEFDRIAKSSKLVVFKQGDYFIKEGTFDDRIYCLISGEVEVVKDKSYTVAAISTPGARFGQLGVIDGQARSAAVRATSDNTICLAINAGQLKETSSNPAERDQILDKLFTTILAERLRHTTETLTIVRKELTSTREELEKAQTGLSEIETIKNQNKTFVRLLKSLEKQISNIDIEE